MMKTKLVAEPNSYEVSMMREFNAPRHLVFKAFTDPKLIPQWWGPHGMKTTVDEMEVRKGGIWRYLQADADGNEYAFNGVYHQVQAPESLVFTFEYEGMPGHIVLETVRFEERDGKTIITDSSVFQTIEDRDGMITAGMEIGTVESWERFEELLKTL